MGFRFTEEQWDDVAAKLEQLGRLKDDIDRWQLESICDSFVRVRPNIGRGIRAPAEAKEAWIEIAKAAAKLESAIAGLRPADAADFAIADWPLVNGIPVFRCCNAEQWAEALPRLVAAARWAAELETHGRRAVSNRSDPVLEGFVLRLVRIWQGFGGRASIGYNDAKGDATGPLLRFLVATTSPALVAVSDEPLSANKIRGIFKKVGKKLSYGELSAENNLSAPLE